MSAEDDAGGEASAEADPGAEAERGAEADGETSMDWRARPRTVTDMEMDAWKGKMVGAKKLRWTPSRLLRAM